MLQQLNSTHAQPDMLLLLNKQDTQPHHNPATPRQLQALHRAKHACILTNLVEATPTHTQNHTAQITNTLLHSTHAAAVCCTNPDIRCSDACVHTMTITHRRQQPFTLQSSPLLPTSSQHFPAASRRSSALEKPPRLFGTAGCLHRPWRQTQACAHCTSCTEPATPYTGLCQFRSPSTLVYDGQKVLAGLLQHHAHHTHSRCATPTANAKTATCSPAGESVHSAATLPRCDCTGGWLPNTPYQTVYTATPQRVSPLQAALQPHTTHL